MWKPSLSRSTLIVLFGVAFVGVGCNSDNTPNLVNQPAKSVPASPTPKSAASPQTNKPVQKPASDTYSQAIDAAESASTIAGSAHSRDDWNLVLNRLEEAIKFLKAVPASSPNKAKAQKKLAQYQNYLAYVKLKVAPPTSKLIKLPNTVAVKQPFFKAPIKYRLSGIPVIDVTFNGSQKFEMLFDTGASSSLISPQMASALSLKPVGKTLVSTANGVAVFYVAFVKSMQVGGAVAQNIPVGIGTPDLDIGLFGQDFYKGYDVSVKQNVIEFSRR